MFPLIGMHGAFQPRREASMAATSIFRIPIMASNARFATAGSGSATDALRARGVICHDSPHFRGWLRDSLRLY